MKIAPSVNSVDTLKEQGEEKQLEFIKAFREIMRLKNILEGFSDFKWSDLSMSEQMFEDYKSKYLDLYEKIKVKEVKVLKRYLSLKMLTLSWNSFIKMR